MKAEGLIEAWEQLLLGMVPPCWEAGVVRSLRCHGDRLEAARPASA